jgi:hypothetical protein
MAKRGRKALVTPTVEWKCRIPVDIAVKVDSYQFDPVRGAVEYGARSSLVTQLLREWVTAHEKSRGVAELDNPSDNTPSTQEGVTP